MTPYLIDHSEHDPPRVTAYSHARPVRALAVSSSGDRVVIGDEAGEVWALKTGGDIIEAEKLGRVLGPVRRLAVAADGFWLAVSDKQVATAAGLCTCAEDVVFAAADQGGILVRDDGAVCTPVSRDALVWRSADIEPGRVAAVDYSWGGLQIAFADGRVYQTDSTVAEWLDLGKTASPAVAMSGDFSGDADGRVYWGTRPGEYRLPSSVTAVAQGRGGTAAVGCRCVEREAGVFGAAVALVCSERAVLRQTLELPDTVTHLEALPGNRFAVATADGDVRLWRASAERADGARVILRLRDYLRNVKALECGRVVAASGRVVHVWHPFGGSLDHGRGGEWARRRETLRATCLGLEVVAEVGCIRVEDDRGGLTYWTDEVCISLEVSNSSLNAKLESSRNLRLELAGVALTMLWEKPQQGDFQSSMPVAAFADSHRPLLVDELETSDIALLAGLMAGQNNAWDLVRRRCLRCFSRTWPKRFHARQPIDELVQVALIRISRGLQRLTPMHGPGLSRWISKICLYTAMGEIKRAKASSRHLGREVSVSCLADTSPSPLQQAMEDESRRSVRRALDRLSQTDSEACRVVELRFFFGVTYDAEIASELGIDRVSVARLCRRGLSRLRELLSSQE